MLSRVLLLKLCKIARRCVSVFRVGGVECVVSAINMHVNRVVRESTFALLCAMLRWGDSSGCWSFVFDALARLLSLCCTAASQTLPCERTTLLLFSNVYSAVPITACLFVLAFCVLLSSSPLDVFPSP